MQMTFGKNRVQYNDFYWNYYRYQPFDVYFSIGGHELAKYVSEIAFEELNNIQRLFSYSLSRRIIFITYNRLSHFRQSNLGLISGDEQYNTGGVTRILNNKVFVYYEGDHLKLRQQIRASIAEVLVNEIFYGGKFKDKVTNSTLINLPEWYLNGLVSYISMDWNPEIENKVKDGITTGRYKKFNRLSGDEATMAGHSFWNYIALQYSPTIITDILYLSKIYKNVESGFLGSTGLGLKELTNDWYQYYQMRYEVDMRERKPWEEEHPVKTKKNHFYQNIQVSPDGKYLSFTSNKMGKYKIYIYDIENDKVRRIFKRGESLEQIIDYSYPIVKWNPNSKILSFMIEEKGQIQLYFYSMEEKELNRRQMLYFDKILNYSYSPNGLQMVLSGVQKGHTNISVFDLASGTSKNLTDDFADDLNPEFAFDGKRVIFQSNRTSTRIKNDSIKNDFDVFILNPFRTDSLLEQLSEWKISNEINPMVLGNNKYLFNSDRIGINNLYLSAYDSAISFIDTSTHYRYFSRNKQLTNFQTSFQQYDFSAVGNFIVLSYLYNNKYHITKTPINLNEEIAGANSVIYRSIQKSQQQYAENLRKQQEEYLKKIREIKEKEEKALQEKQSEKTPKDSSSQNEIDINNYEFSVNPSETDSLKNVPKKQVSEMLARKTLMNFYDADSLPDRMIYRRSFYINDIVSQVDFGFLNASYQSFTGGAVYFNPGMNALTKVGANELFEDYKLVGGVRFAGNFDSNEYLLSLENLEGRVDKQFIFHRQVFQTSGEFIAKVRSHELMYITSFPFDQVSSLKLTTSLRNDYSTLLSLDYLSLDYPSEMRTFAGLKAEYIFDNTIKRSINIYDGIRWKAWFEAYKQLDGKKTDLFVAGFDFRSYVPLHRSLTWANRIAGSKSFGQSRLLYYLGAVDNWVNFSLLNPTFNDTSEVRINNDVNWVYQALATNMRGFIQNARNGDAFLVLNSELRWPVFSYLANRPLNSDFLNTFQLVGFFDAGSAWTGFSPLSDQNYYLNKIVNRNSITVTIDAQRSPVIFGYGFGFRARLFGYYLRTDWAWGIDHNVILPRVFYLSLSTDF
jgi:hypothetical protein